MSSAAILLIDDNPDVARAIALAFDCVGHAVDVAHAPEEAFSMLAQRHYEAILLDLNFTQGQTSGAEGFACLARIVAEDPQATVVVITAHSGIRIAVAAMQAGALDFVIKPWRNADLIARVEAAIAKRARHPLVGASMPAPPHRLLGDSAPIVAARDLIRRIAPTSASVLVSGLAGTGRSLAAALIHEGSAYADDRPSTIDVRDEAAWPRVDAAVGTLILRHVDQIDAVRQARLIDRLPDEVRTITIVDLPERLSPRLRARLGTIILPLPPLAARGADAVLLARHFARVAAERHGKPVPPLTASAEALILAHNLPDEVRGLAQAVERAVLLDDDGVIDAGALVPKLVQAIAAAAPSPVTPLELSLSGSERVMIEAALRQHHHNVSHAAASLGLSRQALYRRMTRHGL
ncbi:sigma-54-dependent transcriptional regulator [Sphingomonas endolithica]|uniref:sigma-54-dependent transcriptional regulator n=1 Tax=Sphingomonas endolithica TaxID=2972485 RepID=UPI0021AF30C0|nr:response regulator [Sphingomonas sp. ZFBP2030]